MAFTVGSPVMPPNYAVSVDPTTGVFQGVDLVTQTELAGTSVPLTNAPTTVVTKTTTYTAAAGDMVLADATSAGFTVTLPAVALGAAVRVKKKDATANMVTVAPASGTIDGGSSFVISQQYESYDFISDGTNWWVA